MKKSAGINDYMASMRKHYPELIAGDAWKKTDESLHIGFLAELMRSEALDEHAGPARFVPLKTRNFASARSAWMASALGNRRWMSSARTYKGLLNWKPASDFTLYSNLIWELQPKTILEFGALQGGSALWFADQLEACAHGGEVHSFELLDKCIHPDAKHPRLSFHHADFRDLGTLDPALFKRLPHPWLVVDDAHENLGKLMPFVASFMHSGDYYVIEDALLEATLEHISQAIALTEALGFLVDAQYCDAFGYNVTCAPNCWFKKA